MAKCSSCGAGRMCEKCAKTMKKSSLNATKQSGGGVYSVGYIRRGSHKIDPTSGVDKLTVDDVEAIVVPTGEKLLLGGGEFIVNSRTVREVGVKFLEKLNKTGIPSKPNSGFKRGQLGRYGSDFQYGGKVKMGDRINRSPILSSANHRKNLSELADKLLNGDLDVYTDTNIILDKLHSIPENLFNVSVKGRTFRNESIIMGDVNCDGTLDVLDIVKLLSIILTGSEFDCPENGDINGDGILNILDVVALIQCILLSCTECLGVVLSGGDCGDIDYSVTCEGLCCDSSDRAQEDCPKYSCPMGTLGCPTEYGSEHDLAWDDHCWCDQYCVEPQYNDCCPLYMEFCGVVSTSLADNLQKRKRIINGWS